MQAEAQARSQAGFGAESNGARSDNEDGDDNDDDDDDGGGLHEGEDGAESAVGQYDVDDAYADVDESAAEQDDEGSLQQDGHQDIEAEVEVEDGEEEEVPGPMASGYFLGCMFCM